MSLELLPLLLSGVWARKWRQVRVLQAGRATWLQKAAPCCPGHEPVILGPPGWQESKTDAAWVLGGAEGLEAKETWGSKSWTLK